MSGGLLVLLFVAGLAGGYVYTHEPARDTLEVVIAAGSGDGTRTINGTVASVEGGRLTLSTAGGQVVVALPAAAPLDELVRTAQGLPSGARVNVGVQSTQYGLVLTGLVAVEGAP
jgi:hypothetical protein